MNVYADKHPFRWWTPVRTIWASSLRSEREIWYKLNHSYFHENRLWKNKHYIHDAVKTPTRAVHTHNLWPVAALMMLQLKQQPAADTVSSAMIPDWRASLLPCLRSRLAQSCFPHVKPHLSGTFNFFFSIFSNNSWKQLIKQINVCFVSIKESHQTKNYRQNQALNLI